jgi:hypothetical protein
MYEFFVINRKQISVVEMLKGGFENIDHEFYERDGEGKLGMVEMPPPPN